MNKKLIIEGVEKILQGIGENPDREGLQGTPERVCRMYEEILGGMKEDPVDHLSTTFAVDSDDLIVEKNIGFYSMCEHHLLPFFGNVHIAYIPRGRVAGLSKLVRTVDVFSKRLQIQERMTGQIADALLEHLDCQGVLVVVEAEHLCMNMRGVKRQGTLTRTLAARGSVEKDHSLQHHLLQVMGLS